MPPPPNPALIELSAVLGEEKARVVVRTFLQGFPAALHELTRGDRTRRQRAAHSLKSSARQMGALPLSQFMAELEKRLARPDGTVTPADLAATAAAFSESAPVLRAFAG